MKIFLNRRIDCPTSVSYCMFKLGTIWITDRLSLCDLLDKAGIENVKPTDSVFPFENTISADI